MITNFKWNNGTASNPVILTTNQINALIAAGRNSSIITDVRGYVKTQTGIYKYLKYSLNTLFPNLVVQGKEVADAYNINSPSSNLLEGNSLTLNVSSSTGMTAADLKYKIIFGTVTTDNVLSEEVIKSRISISKGVLQIANPQENGSWSVPVTIKACPLYEDIDTTTNYVETSSIVCRAIALTNFRASASVAILPTNTSTPISYIITPSNSTKLSTATITGSITSGDGNFADDVLYAYKSIGNLSVVITCVLKGGATFNSTVTVGVRNSTKSTISIWNGGKTEAISDTKSMVTGDVVADPISCTISADTQDNVIAKIRAGSHLYVGKYYGRAIGMKLKQLDDNDRTKYSDGTTAVIDGTPDANRRIGDVFLKLPTFYYKAVTNATDPNKVDVIFSTGNDVEGTYTKWDTNTLIGVYKGTILNNNAVINSGNVLTSDRNFTEGDTLHSISGKIPTVYYSQNSFKKAARARNTSLVGVVPSDGFSIITYEAHVVMALLYYGYYGGYDINCQKVIGYGTSSYPKITGATNSFGMKDTYSSSLSGTGDSNSISFWGLENWWGDIYEWVDNLITANSTGLINIQNWQGNTVRTVKSNIQLNTEQTVSKMVWNTQLAGACDLIPYELSGSGDYTKHYADSGYVGASSGYVALRSKYGSYAHGGVGCLILGNSSSSASGNDGSRLVFSGTVTDITGTDEASSF